MLTCPHHKQPVSNMKSTVFLRRTSIDDLGDIYAVVTRDVLVSNSTGDAKAKPCKRQPRSQTINSNMVQWCGQKQTCRQSRATCFSSPLGPLTSLISMMVSSMGLRRLTYSRTMEPATFRASTALLWETSETSESFTRRMQSFTLVGKQQRV